MLRCCFCAPAPTHRSRCRCSTYCLSHCAHSVISSLVVAVGMRCATVLGSLSRPFERRDQLSQCRIFEHSHSYCWLCPRRVRTLRTPYGAPGVGRSDGERWCRRQRRRATRQRAVPTGPRAVSSGAPVRRTSTAMLRSCHPAIRPEAPVHRWRCDVSKRRCGWGQLRCRRGVRPLPDGLSPAAGHGTPPCRRVMASDRGDVSPGSAGSRLRQGAALRAGR